MSEGEEDVVRRLPSRKAKEKRIKLETPESDEEGGEDDQWAEEENEMEKGVAQGKEDNKGDDSAESDYEEEA